MSHIMALPTLPPGYDPKVTGPSARPALVSGPSLREQARQVIRALIITGQMTADQLYSVPRIAAELHVSATPVREALLDLASEGLLEPVRNRGFRVVTLDSNELHDIYAIRLLLEVPSAGEVARKGISGEELSRLRQLAGLISEAAKTQDLVGYLEADRQFHIGLVDALGNQPLTDLVATLRDRVRLHGLLGDSTGDHIIKSAEEHFALLDCVAKGDPRGASAVMRRHLERSRQVWVEEVRRSAEPAPAARD